jgi:hypothetical protein
MTAHDHMPGLVALRRTALVLVALTSLALLLPTYGHAYLYFAGDGGIVRANLDGTGAHTFVSTGREAATGVAVTSKYIYWSSSAVGEEDAGCLGGRIERANIDGTHVNPNFIPGLRCPGSIAIAGGYMYWLEAGVIGRASLNGSAINKHFIVLPVAHTSTGWCR